MELRYDWRGPFDEAELNAVHAEGFGHRLIDIPWRAQLERHSLGWVCAHAGERLVGFVNVAWDEGVHAFLLDTLVTSDLRRQGIARELVARAVAGARDAGCEWLHVDFEGADLRAFCMDACGFRPTKAGLIALV